MPITMKATLLGTIGGPEGSKGYHEVPPPGSPNFVGVGGDNTSGKDRGSSRADGVPLGDRLDNLGSINCRGKRLVGLCVD